jgi:hypothetical protein
MNRNDEPTIVSLESHRRKRLADSRKRAGKARPPGERAINWRRVPLFLAAAALLMLFSWLMRYAGAAMHLFH